MKNFTKLLGAFALFFLLSSQSVLGSHLKGGDTYIKCLGGGQYELVFACYYACEAASIGYDTVASDFSWTVTSSCGSVPSTIFAVTASQPMDVPLYCPGVLTQCDYFSWTLENTTGLPYANAPANAPIGTLVITYTSAPFAIPPGCTVNATMFFSARNAAISNLVNPSIYGINIVASVTAPLDGSCNNNPEFAQFPVNVFCLGKNANFSQGAIDLNGDSLTYTLVNPETSGGVAIPFVTGCTPSNPLGVGAGTGFASVFTFDSTNGNINFTPTASGDYVLTVQVDDYHNGVLVGTTMRDIQFTVVVCNYNDDPPTLGSFTLSNVTGATVIDSNHIGVCPGQQVNFNLLATDIDSFSYIIDSSNVSQILPGATVTYTNRGRIFDTTDMHVTWTPTASDSGFYFFVVTVKDTICPQPGRNTYAFEISVLTGVSAGPNLVYCNGGAPDTIYASGSDHYVWYDSATGGPPKYVLGYGPDSSYIVVDPGTAQGVPLGSSVGYVVQGDLSGSCKNRDTMSVKNAPDFTLAVGTQDTSICKYTSTVLTATPTPSNVGPFTYSWSPASSVVSPTSASTSTTGLTASTDFSVTVVAAGGCAIRGNVNVDISGAAPRITILPSNNNVCPGDTVSLNSLILTENIVTCGLVDTCTSNALLYSVAVNNDTSSTTGYGGAGGYTDVYGSPFMGTFNSYKAQYLFTKAELNAAGLSSGSITDISFFVKTINSTAPYDTFSISMGCTQLDSLTGFVNNLLTVLPPQMGPNAITPNQGWTPLPFTSYYNWDGSSNLIVQVCYTINPLLFSQDDFVSYTTTPYSGSSIIAGDDFGENVDGCSLDATADFYLINNTRPNIKFGMCVPNVLTYDWTPSTLVCNNCPDTKVIVNGDTTYKLTVSDGQCTNDTSVRITINPYIAITATPDTTLCSVGDTVQLHTGLANPPASECVQGYTVTSVPYSPIAGSVTAVPPVDFLDASGFDYSTLDGTAGPFTIGFNFPFYCQTYSNFYINSNGWLTFQYPYPFNNPTDEYTAQTLPSPDPQPAKVIELMMGNYWLADGFGDGGGSVDYFVSGTAPNRILVVQFVDMLDASLTYTTSGEMHLHETTGEIDVLISSSDYAGTQHTTGVSDSSGIGTAAPGRNNQFYTITTPEEWKFMPQFGPSVAVNNSVWTPNTFLSNNTISDPLAYPPGTQTYYVTDTLVINQYTHPSTCVVRDSVEITITPISSTVTATPPVICPGDTTQLNFTSAATISSYAWTPAAGLSSTTISDPLASVLDTTTYRIVATTSSGCQIVNTVTVDVIPTQHPQIGPGGDVCYSDSMLLSLLQSGTYANYQWFSVDSVTGVRTLVSSGPSDTTYYAHPSGQYVVELTPLAGQCNYYSNVVDVDSFPAPELAVDTSGPAGFCAGSSVTLSVQPGYSNVNWTPASFGAQSSITVSAAGSYSYTATDVHGCLLYSDTEHVTVSQPPAFVLNNYQNPICASQPDTLIATSSPAGATITWVYNGNQSTGNTLIINTPGTDSIYADLQGCMNDTAITISAAPSPDVILPSSYSLCDCHPNVVISPVSVSGGTPGYTYLWSNGGTGSTTIDSILNASTYTLTVTDANHCTAVSNTDTITMSCPGVTISVSPPADTIFLDDTATLTATGPVGSSYSFLWSGDSALILAPASSVTGVVGLTMGSDSVYLVVTDPATGCMDTTATAIHVIDYGNFVMPTAFTPNNDNMNEFFYPVFNGPNSTAQAVTFRIYNRWGELVYDAAGPPGWNGQFQGQPQPSGTYLYFITVQYPNPNNPSQLIDRTVEGSFMLFR